MERDFKGIWIPKEIWLSKELTTMEKLFYVEINSLDNEKGCFASNDYFAKFFDLSTVHVSRIINSLVEKGYISSSIDKANGNKRILHTLLTKMLIPINKNVNTPINKNVNTPINKNVKSSYSNTILNNTDNKERERGACDSFIAELLEYRRKSLGVNILPNMAAEHTACEILFANGFTIEQAKAHYERLKNWRERRAPVTWQMVSNTIADTLRDETLERKESNNGETSDYRKPLNSAQRNHAELQKVRAMQAALINQATFEQQQFGQQNDISDPSF